jgi:hypothetical protein
MPPIKGRLLERRPIVVPVHCFKSAFGQRHLRPKPPITTTIGRHTAERALKKLRIPESLCRSLPSVRRFKDRETEIIESSQVKVSDSSPVIILDDDDDVSTISKLSLIPGVKKNATNNRSQYRVKQVLEAKFGAMVWDVAFLPVGGIVISHANGALLCDDELGIKKTLENVRSGGGIATFSDGRIAIVCCFNDTVNIFAPLGAFQKSFSCRGNPASVAINNQGELLVCDIGEKCVHVMDENGLLLRTIASSVSGSYTLQWPEYILTLPDDSMLVCDVHQQRVLKFGSDGLFAETLPLRTVGNLEVLRPQGLCQGPGDSFFVVDGATDCVEGFTRKGRYIQTIFNGSDADSRQLKAKVVRMDNTHQRMLVGGLTGTVKLLHLTEGEEVNAASVKIETATSAAQLVSNNNVNVFASASKICRFNVGKKVMVKVKLPIKRDNANDVIVLD